MPAAGDGGGQIGLVIVGADHRACPRLRARGVEVSGVIESPETNLRFTDRTATPSMSAAGYNVEGDHEDHEPERQLGRRQSACTVSIPRLLPS
jgi:hypothetical protein